MAEEEKKFKKAKPHMKLDSPSPDKNSRFFKRCAAKFSLVPSDNSFRFNFSPSKDATEENITEAGLPDANKENNKTQVKPEQSPVIINDSENLKPKTDSSFRYNMSDNSFRFNFNVEENDD